MTLQDMLLRLGLALAIGLLVGIERHWRERDAEPGSRTAGLRTFGLSGLLGGVAALSAQSPVVGGGLAGAVLLAGALIAFTTSMTVFKLREAWVEDTTSVTGVVAAILVFLLGVYAVLGERVVAAATGVTMTALLASREVLHGLMQRLSWAELRSAIIILVMSFVALPLMPRTPVGPFGGVDPAEVWTLAILMASISYAGYLAVKLMGPQRGLLLSGALGGLASSTAVTVMLARRAAADEAPPTALAAGALVASAVAVLRIGGLALALRPDLLASLGPVLGLMAAGFLAGATVCAVRSPADSGDHQNLANPFDLWVIARFTILIALASFLVKAGLALVGEISVVPLAALGGLADADAVVLALARPSGTAASSEILTLAIFAAVSADIVAKSIYAIATGGRRFGLAYGSGAAGALAAGGAGLWLMRYPPG